MTTKYEELKSAIVAAVPSIMELKFGCEVTLAWQDGEEKDFVFIENKENDDEIYVYAIGHSYTYRCSNLHQILGRPITLEDCLATLNVHKAASYGIDNQGQFIKLYPDETFAELTVMNTWQMGKPLSEQSQETIDFLHSLLVTK